MAKGRKQTASELINRYAAETGGLAATLEPSAPAPRPNPILATLRRNVNQVVVVPLEILTIEENVRQAVDESSPEFASLVDSIRAHGIRQNIVVDLREHDESNFKVVVLAGQRRVLAGRKAGVKQVAALVLRLPERGQRLAEGLAENLLREDLHCLDQAEAYAALLAEGWSEDQIAETFERRRKTVLQFLRLARYPEKAKKYIRAHKDVFTAYLLFNKFIAKSWKSEAELLEKLREAVAGKRKVPAAKPVATPEFARLARAVQGFNGLRCKVSGSAGAGKLTISFQNRAALQKLIKLFEAGA
jgi:ParB/RepB/Spo0J family partition protein